MLFCFQVQHQNCWLKTWKQWTKGCNCMAHLWWEFGSWPTSTVQLSSSQAIASETPCASGSIYASSSSTQIPAMMDHWPRDCSRPADGKAMWFSKWMILPLPNEGELLRCFKWNPPSRHSDHSSPHFFLSYLGPHLHCARCQNVVESSINPGALLL